MNETLAWGLAAAFGVALLLVTALWRGSALRQKRRERVWRSALRALAKRDFAGVEKRAASLENYGARASTRAAKSRDKSAHTLRETAVTLRQRDEERERARRDLEDVLSSLQDAVLVVDGEARVRFLNAAALRFFAVRIEDVLGATLLEALPSFGLDAAVQSALQRNQSTAQEMNLYVPAGGGQRDVLLRVAPVRSGGGVSGAVAITQDLTETRRLERVRRDFVANASHELRTPVANIRAGAETILDDPEDAALIRRFLPRIVSEAERLSHLVTDLLDLARVETGEESASTRSVVELGEIAARVVASLSDKAARGGVHLYCDVVGKARLRADGAALEQVAFNLVDNALSYTPPGGRVALRVWGREDDDEESDARPVQLEVADSGIGIPDADLERIFERFYRVDKARSRAQGGTGLGLAIVKHVVENHGGFVAVKSEVGRGTTFTVTLPVS